ncbi:MAG TPA: hypothetical protein VI522_06005, partial [Gammaproteobacteria bacterium]|nr:hypothetical protein [Gammaproteobacteria bacterium]
SVIIDAIPNTEKQGIHYHHRLLFAYQIATDYINNEDLLAGRKNELFSAGFYYPEVVGACPPDELESLLNIINDAYVPYTQPVLQLKLYLMQLGDETLLNTEALLTLATNKPLDASATLFQETLKKQVARHLAAHNLIEESNLSVEDKARLEKALFSRLQKFIEKNEKVTTLLEQEAISSIYSLANALGVTVNQVLAFNNDRTFSPFSLTDRAYDHASLSGGTHKTTEWKKEVDELQYQRVGYIYDTAGKNVLTAAKKLMGTDTKYAQYRPDYLKLVYKNDPAVIVSNAQRSIWHEEYYDAFETLMPLMMYMHVQSGLPEFHIHLENPDSKTNGLGVIYTKDNIYYLRHDKAKTPLTLMQGCSSVCYKVGPEGYHIDFMVHEGNEFYVNYARLALFYNLFAKHPDYKIKLHREQDNEESVTAALQKQIAVLRAADHCYLAFNPHTPQDRVDTYVLNKLKEVKKDNAGVYCLDNYNGRPMHRRFVEGCLSLFSTDLFLFSPECLAYYAKIFNCALTNKEDLPYVLHQFSLTAVKSDFQNKIFTLLGNYLQGNLSEQACLQQIIALKENDLDGQCVQWFSACHIRLEQLNKHNPLKSEISELMGTTTNFAALGADPKLQAYMSGIGNDKEKINAALVNFFASYTGIESVRAYFRVQQGNSLTAAQLSHLLVACQETEDFVGKQKQSTDQMLSAFLQALQYPHLLTAIKQEAKSLQDLEQAQQLLRAEFKWILHALKHLLAKQFTAIQHKLLYELCINPRYKHEVLTELKLYKREFSHAPAGMTSEQLCDELLALHLKYDHALAEFLGNVKSSQIPYEVYQQIQKADQATQKYCSAFAITEVTQVRDVFLMQLHSLVYYPADKSMAMVMSQEIHSDATAIKQVARSDTYVSFIRRHQLFSTKWQERDLSHTPSLSALSVREQIALKNHIIELQRFYNNDSVQDEMIEQFFRTIASGYMDQINKYTDLHRVARILLKDDKNKLLFKSIVEHVFNHKNAKVKHPLLCLFNAIKNNDFLTEKEKEALYPIAVDRYQKYGSGHDEAIIKLAQADNGYSLLLLLNQSDLIHKYRKVIGAKPSMQGLELSKTQLETLHLLPVGRLAHRAKDSDKMSDQAIFEKLVALTKENVSVYKLLRVYTIYPNDIAQYLNSHDLSANTQKHLIDIFNKVEQYLNTHAHHIPLRRMLMVIALYDPNFFMKEQDKAAICKQFNTLQQVQQYKVNPKIMTHGFDKLAQDLRIPLETLISDQRLKQLIDIYCDDELRPVLIQLRKRIPVDLMQNLVSYQAYYQAIAAYNCMLNKKDYAPARRDYFELLLCSLQFERIIVTIDDI